jgi:hypothetical protein
MNKTPITTTNTGIVYSDIDVTIHDQQIPQIKNGNNGKIGFYANIHTNYPVFKFLSIEGGITYQERLPLEIYWFPIGDPNAPPGVAQRQYFTSVPTSPQSKNWNPDEFKRLPNFKYLYAEFIPTATFGKKIRFSAGFGIFYGYLLNHKSLVFTKEDFPVFASFFKPPFYVYGQDSYLKDDFGWLPSVSFSIPLSKQLAITSQFKGYISQIALKTPTQTKSKFSRPLNINWVAISCGIGLSYKLIE